MLGVGQVVVVEQSGVGFRDELAGWRVEYDVVEPVEWSSLVVALLRPVVNTIDHLSARLRRGMLVELHFSFVVRSIAGVEGFGVAFDGELPVNNRIFAGEIGLVEVIRMLHVRSSQARFQHDRSVWSHKHGHTPCTPCRSRVTLLIQCNVSGYHDGISAIPARRLDPVDGVEEGIRPTVACIDGIDPFDIGVARRSKQLHQHRLDRLGFVEKRFGAYLQPTDGAGIYRVLAQERRHGREGKGIDILHSQY